MNAQARATRTTRWMIALAATFLATQLLSGPLARAAERKYLVTLATSAKQYAGCENNQPVDGLVNDQLIFDQYFDKLDDDIGSFAEYWEEISYGDVTVTGDVTQWLVLPWAIEPPLVTPACPPSEGERLSPEDFVDLSDDGQYAYGMGEGFNNSFDSVIIDLDGDPGGVDNGPFTPGPGSGHVSEGGLGAAQDVFKPGERYIDMDGDNKWDGFDEANNWMDFNLDGIPDLPGPWYDLNNDNAGRAPEDCVYLADSDNDGNPDCCPDGPDTQGCGGITVDQTDPDACPPTNWQGPGGVTIDDCNGNLIPDACDVDCDSQECRETGWTGSCGGSLDVLPFEDDDDLCVPGDGDGIPDECQWQGIEENECVASEAEDPEDPCFGPDHPACVPLERTVVPRCEYSDSNASEVMDIVEPFENFLRRWDPCYYDPDVSPDNVEALRTHWIKVYDPNSESAVACEDPESGFAYAADTVFQLPFMCTGADEVDCADTSDCPAGETCNTNTDNPLYVRSYIENNYPGPSPAVVAEAQSRVIYGEHDPLGKLTGPCVCSDGSDCGDRTAEIPQPDGTVEEIDLVGGYCPAGVHADYDPSDRWTEVDSSKMRAAPGSGGRATFITATPEPGQSDSPLTPLGEEAWFPQAWEDRYNGDLVTAVALPPCLPAICGWGASPSPAPAWPAGWDENQPGGPGVPPGVKPNTLTFEPWSAELDGDDNIRRFFKANFGGTNGDGTGWIGTNGRPIVFEIGLTGLPSFEDNMDAPIMPEEQDGIGQPGAFFDGWVEHDDLPSSKYHRAGDQRLGEVTSPWRSVATVGDRDIPAIFGHDLGTHEWGGSGPGGGDQITPAAGPLAVFIHGNSGRDAGNLLIMEYLTWRTDGTSRSYGLAREIELNDTRHPFAGAGSTSTPSELIGFMDYNLDGMIDEGEVRVAGSENYVADSLPGTPNDGSGSEYPWNRERLIEDCVEIMDEFIDFGEFIDGVTLARINCPNGVSGDVVPPWYEDFDAPEEDLIIVANGVVSGIVLLPADSSNTVGQAFIGASSLSRPIHNEDNDDPEDMYPKDPNKPIKISWNLIFHDLIISMGDVTRFDTGTIDYMASYSAHEYLHSWEGFPDLYDLDIYGEPGPQINTPVGQWDIMAGSERVPLNRVHSVPILKEKPCTEWISPTDLTTVLTPGVPITLTLPVAEKVRDDSYFFIENENKPGERMYFWSAGGWPESGPTFDTPGYPGFGAPNLITDGLPGEGMLVLHTDVGSNPDALPANNQGPTRFEYRIIQADGLGDLEAGVAPYGDPGDPFPGSTGNTTFGFNTNPPARWWTQESWTGIKITDVRPDGVGSVTIDISWRPTSIPSLEFTQPPGGVSVPVPPDVIYQVRAEATDVYGGTYIRFFHTLDTDDPDPVDFTIDPDGANYVGALFKLTPGTHLISVDWNIANVPDNRYRIFAELVPGLGAGEFELSTTTPRRGRNNVGNGSMTVNNVDVSAVLASGEWDPVTLNPAAALTKVVMTDPNAVYGPLVPYFDYLRVIDGQNVVPGFYYIWRVDSNTLAIIGPDDPRAGPGAAIVTSYQLFDGDGLEIYASTIPSPLTDFDGFLPLPETDMVTAGVSVGDQIMYEVANSRSPQMRSVVAFLGDGPGDMRTLELSTPLFTGNQAFVVNWQALSTGQARSETWVAECLAVTTNDSTWVVTSTLTQVAPDGTDDLNDLPAAWKFTVPLMGSASYTSIGGEVTFTIDEDDTGDPEEPARRFIVADRFTFVTTGVTSASAFVNIVAGEIDENPTAVIEAAPLAGDAPLTVNFDGRDSNDPAGEQLEYLWDFGDGTPTADGAVEIHTFVQARTFSVVLRVTNPNSRLFDEAAVDIVVNNNSPHALITADPTSGPTPLTVQFSGAQSSDTENDTNELIFEWDFGDGDTAGTGVPGELIETEHFFADDGTYLTTLTVTDDGGKMDVDTVWILVGNTNPTPVVFYTSLIGGDPHTITFNALQSFDPDGDAMTMEWIWGDGSPNETHPVSGAPPAVDGSVPHEFLLQGDQEVSTYEVSGILRDAQGGQTNWPGVTVTVNTPGPGSSRPIASFTINPNPPVAGEPFAVNASQSIDLPIGDLIATYSWDWGDGATPETVASALATHTYAEDGVYTITLTVADGETPPNTHSTSQTVTVGDGDGGDGSDPGSDPTNQPPVARMVITPDEGTAGVTIFEFDAALSSDADGDTDLTYLWEFGDGANDDGVEVTHVYAEVGTYTVRLTVRDSRNGSSVATEQVIVRSQGDNFPPRAFISAGQRTGTAPVTLTFNGTSSFDPNGDPLEFSWEFRVNGVLIHTANAALVSYTFTDAGTYFVQLTVRDGRGGSDTTGALQVNIAARGTLPPAPGVSDPEEGAGVPDGTNSASNRPTGLCGFGMVMSLFGSLVGLSAMRMTRRRLRW